MAKYTKQEWIDNETLINADKLNHIEDGIESANEDADSALSKATEVEGEIPTKVSQLDNDVPYATQSDLDSVADTAITGINVNGTPAPVTDHVAEIEVEGGNGSVYYTYVGDADIRGAYVTVDISGLTDRYPADGTMLALWFRDCTSDTPIVTIIINSLYEFVVRPFDTIIPSQSEMVLFVCMDGVFIASNDPALIAEIKQSAITSITVNGKDVPVEDNKAEITVSGAEPTVEDETLIF